MAVTYTHEVFVCLIRQECQGSTTELVQWPRHSQEEPDSFCLPALSPLVTGATSPSVAMLFQEEGVRRR